MADSTPTDAMIAAGIAALSDFSLSEVDLGWQSREELVSAVFVAMEQAHREAKVPLSDIPQYERLCPSIAQLERFPK